MNKEENYLDGIDYAMDIGYAQYLEHAGGNWHKGVWADHIIFNSEGIPLNIEYDKNRDETRLFDFDGLLVEVTLPRGEFK